MSHRPQHLPSWSCWIEAGILLAVTPFLLFPSFNTLATCFSLLGIILLWLLPIMVRQWPWPASTPFDLIWILWGTTLVVGILVTADPDFTLPKATGLILGLAVWRFMNRAIQSRRGVMVGLLGYALLGVGFIVLGAASANWVSKVPLFATIATQLPSGLLLLPESPELGVHTNQLAGTLLFYIPFLMSVLIGFVCSRPSKWIQITWLCITLFTIGLLVLTQSRTGWLAFAGSIWLLGLLWWIALPNTDRRRRWFAWLTVALLILGGVGLALIGPQRLQTIWADPAQDSAVGQLGSIGFRQEVWRWGVTAVQDFPFTGTGLGSFREVVRRLYPLNVAPDYDIAHAHNLFLQVALDVGIPGLIAYLAMVGLLFAVGIWAARRDERLRPYTLGILAGLVAYHLFGLADALAPGSKPHLIFWIMCGLITATHRLAVARWQKEAAVLSLRPF